MGYNSDILQHRVAILNKVVTTGFGETTGYQYAGTVSSDLEWVRGTKALREGALDAYDVVIFRMRWNPLVKRDSVLECEGMTYQIKSFHADRHHDTIQITATEMVQLPTIIPNNILMDADGLILTDADGTYLTADA